MRLLSYAPTTHGKDDSFLRGNQPCAAAHSHMGACWLRTTGSHENAARGQKWRKRAAMASPRANNHNRQRGKSAILKTPRARIISFGIFCQFSSVAEVVREDLGTPSLPNSVVEGNQVTAGIEGRDTSRQRRRTAYWRLTKYPEKAEQGLLRRPPDDQSSGYV